MPWIKSKFFDDNNNPLTGGKVYTYLANSQTPAVTYKDYTCTTANSNPIILDSRGEADIWLDADLVYKIVVHDSLDVEVFSVDGVKTSLGGGGGGGIEFVTTQDTDSIDLEGMGTNTNPLTASVRVSDLSLNAISVTSYGITSQSTGLYVNDLNPRLTSVENAVQVIETDITNLDARVTTNETNISQNANSIIHLQNTKEDYLGLPSSNGQILSSDTLGNRTWIDDDSGLLSDINNIGSGAEVFKQITGSGIAQFRTLSDGSFVEFVQNANDVSVDDSAIQTALDSKQNTLPNGASVLNYLGWSGSSWVARNIDYSEIQNPPTIPTNYVTTNSTQSGLSGDKTWSGLHTFGAGVSVSGVFDGGAGLKLPNGSWIRPQTIGQPLFLTLGATPDISNSGLQLLNDSVYLSSGNGSSATAQIVMSSVEMEFSQNSGIYNFSSVPTSTPNFYYGEDVSGNLVKFSAPSIPTNYVTTDSTQTGLTGDKTWEGIHTFADSVYVTPDTNGNAVFQAEFLGGEIAKLTTKVDSGHPIATTTAAIDANNYSMCSLKESDQAFLQCKVAGVSRTFRVKKNGFQFENLDFGTLANVYGEDLNGDMRKVDVTSFLPSPQNLQSVTDQGASTTNVTSYLSRLLVGGATDDGVTALQVNGDVEISGGLSANSIGVSQTDGLTGLGLSLRGGYQSGLPSYGFSFAKTSVFGNYGAVDGDWAVYSTINNGTIGDRGWIWGEFDTESTPPNPAMSLGYNGILTTKSRVNVNGAIDNTSYAINVNGSINLTSGSNFYINGTPISGGGSNPWVTPTYATGWIAPNGPGGDPVFQELKYQDDGGEINIVGVVQRSGSGLTLTDTLLFTLPVGARPSKQLEYIGSMGNNGQQNGNTIINVKTNGDVTATNVNYLNTNEYIRINMKVVK